MGSETFLVAGHHRAIRD